MSTTNRDSAGQNARRYDRSMLFRSLPPGETAVHQNDARSRLRSIFRGIIARSSRTRHILTPHTHTHARANDSSIAGLRSADSAARISRASRVTGYQDAFMRAARHFRCIRETPRCSGEEEKEERVIVHSSHYASRYGAANFRHARTAWSSNFRRSCN